MRVPAATRLIPAAMALLPFAQTLLSQTQPGFNFQPTNAVVTAGTTTTLSAGDFGAGPVGYQWYFNNAPASIDGTITTVAGGGVGDHGPATNAAVSLPAGLAVDSAGSLLIADLLGNRIRKVSNGIITTVAGTGVEGYSGDSQPATAALLNNPSGVAMDVAGNIFIADTFNNRIRRIATNGVITTVAGSGGQTYSGDNGAAISAAFNLPQGLTLDAVGNIFIADTYNNRIRKIATNGVITTVAGNGAQGYAGDGGAATNASLNFPYNVAVSATGDLFIADCYNHRVRMVGTNGIINTLVGTGASGYSGDGGPATNAQLNHPQGLMLDAAGNLFIADDWNNCVRKMAANGIITTVVGDGIQGYSGDRGPATNAELTYPTALALDASSNIFVAEAGGRVRKVAANGIITTLAGNGSAQFGGDGGSSTNAALSGPTAVAADDMGNLFIADTGNNRIRRVSPNGIISTAVGNGSNGSAGDGGPATNAEIAQPDNIAVDGAGNLFIADGAANRIRKVGTNGIITSVAGNGTPGFAGDGGRAGDAELNDPFGVVADAHGNLFIADYGNGRVRKIGSNGFITTVAGGGSAYPGDGGLATNAVLSRPWALTVDATGNLLISCYGDSVVHKVEINGILTTLAGFSKPCGLAVDATGDLFVADPEDHRVSKVGTNGIISTVAGDGLYSPADLGDGGPATNAWLLYPYGVVVDAVGNIYIADSGQSRVRKVIASNLSLAAGGATLVLSNVTAANAGNYFVVITNAYGAVTSSIATLTIAPSPTRFTAISLTNDGVTISYTATPSSNYILWSAINLTPPVSWTPITTNTADATGHVTVFDTNTAALPAKFYRLSLP